MKGLYASLLVGIVILTTIAFIFQVPRNILPGGGAFLCFTLLTVIFLLEKLYQKVVGK